MPISRSQIASLVTEHLSELLASEVPVKLDDNFFDLGGDSLVAMEFTAFMSRTLNRSVPVVLIYDEPLLADYIDALGFFDTDSRK